MHPINARHLLVALATITIVAVIGLWSWNTLAELFGAPQAQFRHALAALALLLLLRLATRRRYATIRHHRRS